VTSGETLSRAGGRGEAGGVTGVVVVAHGGRSVSAEPTAAFQPAVIRMIPVARAIQSALQGSGAVVCRPRFAVRGWNGDQASPVDDLSRILDGVRDQHGPVPIILVGHSMGARAAMRVAGHPAVSAVAGLAPWLPAGEHVDQLAGRRILLVHGNSDRVTSPQDTWAFAERAGSVTEVTAIEICNGEHAMLRRANLWHSLAAEFTRMALRLPSTSRELEAALGRTTRGSRTTL
jgi:pimeloyl-ACP methyl ester carboxylesterase